MKANEIGFVAKIGKDRCIVIPEGVPVKENKVYQFIVYSYPIEEAKEVILDNDLINHIPDNQRNAIIKVKTIINELEKVVGKSIPIHNIFCLAEKEGVSMEKSKEIIERLKRGAAIFEPKKGFIQNI